MPRFDLIFLSRCKPGEEEAFEEWYANRHLPDVCAIDGVVSARFAKARYQKDYDLNPPPFGYLAIYEMEGDDPNAIMESILAVPGSDVMPLSPVLVRDTMIQAIGETVATYP